VSLADGCGCQRLWVERCKHALGFAAELGCDELPNELGPKTRRVVLQLRQFDPEFRAE
jgi:hypothetical protein